MVPTAADFLTSQWNAASSLPNIVSFSTKWIEFQGLELLMITVLKFHVDYIVVTVSRPQIQNVVNFCSQKSQRPKLSILHSILLQFTVNSIE